MTSYNKQKRILISWGNEMKAEGWEEGRAEGWEEGRAEGREEGRAEGREEGRAEGRKESKEKILSAVRDYFYRSGFSEDLQKEVLNDITLAMEKS